jgi:tetratricopeptide (TPR) repeat protein
MFKLITRTIQWLGSRVAVIYLIALVFCFTCVDLKNLNMRIKTRHLNDAIPDFSNMITFSQDPAIKNDLDWMPYKNYFELVLRYLPDDVLTKQLLAYADYYSGQEQKAIDLFQQASTIHGQYLFWPNYNLGVLYYRKGMWPQAADALFKAIASNPELTLILDEKSMVYRQIRSSPDFKYSLSDEIKGAQGDAYVLLLSTLHHLRQYNKIFVVAKIALTNPNLPDKDAFYYYTGLGLYEAGQLEKAFLFFQKSLALEKNNPEVYYYIANIFKNIGQQEQAKDYYQASYLLHQKNDPRFPYDARMNLRFF